MELASSFSELFLEHYVTLPTTRVMTFPFTLSHTMVNAVESEK